MAATVRQDVQDVELTSDSDTIRVNNISILAAFTDGAQWLGDPSKPKLQPITLTLSISHSIASTAHTDNLDLSINYSTVCKTAIDVATSRAFRSCEDLVNQIFAIVFERHAQVQALKISLTRPKALQQPAYVEFSSFRSRGQPGAAEVLSLRHLECHPIVGVNICEREQTQAVRFDLSMRRSTRTPHQARPFPFRALSRKVIDTVDKTDYLTLEALVSLVADTVLLESPEIDSVTVCGGKPDALACAQAAEVEITRTRADIATPGLQVGVDTLHRVAIALGSNMGDRFANIELALRLLEDVKDGQIEGVAQAYLTVVDTSFLYETQPMYVADQPEFINCACLVETNIPPVSLLLLLKDIEARVGRVESFRNGPRAVDLDILTFSNQVLDTRDPHERERLDNLEGHLVVPHPRLWEREFVLRPLNDIIPDYVHPVLKRTVRRLFETLTASTPPGSPPMNKVIPFPQYPVSLATRSEILAEYNVPLTATYWTFPAPTSHVQRSRPSKTYIMATLNATPDSFSDGSVHNTVPTALSYATSSISQGADIIDIGGYSTRPNAEFVSSEDEISRVVPIVQKIRDLSSTGLSNFDDKACEQASRALISVDTFRPEVAAAAVHAGANCINDVYAFTGPEYPTTDDSQAHFAKMRAISRELAVPVILMHSRGEASQNKDYSQYNYAADASGRGAVLEGIRVELGQKVDAAVKGKGGLRRWFVIIDPGVGFSKTVEGNLEVLRGCGEIVAHLPKNSLAGYPQLVGASRKSFLGTILASPDEHGTYKGRETKPVERGFSTAAAVACAVQQGATVVRVHDVLEMGDVVRVASLLWG